MDIDEANKAFAVALREQTTALTTGIARLLGKRPTSPATNASKEAMDAIHFEYDWESFQLVAIPLNTHTSYCGKALSIEFPVALIPPAVESALTQAMDDEDDDFCDELREKMTNSYVAWFKAVWEASREIAPDVRGFLSVHDTIWRTDLDTGEEFREDAGPIKFY